MKETSNSQNWKRGAKVSGGSLNIWPSRKIAEFHEKKF